MAIPMLWGWEPSGHCPQGYRGTSFLQKVESEEGWHTVFDKLIHESQHLFRFMRTLKIKIIITILANMCEEGSEANYVP